MELRSTLVLSHRFRTIILLEKMGAVDFS